MTVSRVPGRNLNELKPRSGVIVPASRTSTFLSKYRLSESHVLGKSSCKAKANRIAESKAIAHTVVHIAYKKTLRTNTTTEHCLLCGRHTACTHKIVLHLLSILKFEY
jgi:hypothetical protein